MGKLKQELDFFGLPVNPGTACTAEEGKTRQSDADSADINKVLRRAGITDPRQLILQQGNYMDVSDVGDYRALSDRLARVRQYFEGLPAELRKEFGNDSLRFLDVVNDPANADQLIEWGVFVRPDGYVPRSERKVPEVKVPEVKNGEASK